MNFPIIKKTNRLERFFILILLLIAGLCFGTAISVVFTKFLKCNTLDLLRLSQISSQIFTFTLPPILYAIFVKKDPLKSLGFNKVSIKWLLIGLVLIFAITPLNSAFAEWNANIKLPESMREIELLMQEMQAAATSIIEQFVNVDSISGLILNLFMIAGLAALGEELLFRSVIQNSLINICKNAHIGIILASMIFSFIHFEFYGFVPRFVLGLILGYMYYYSRSIWVPMAMHFVNNGTIVFIYFLNHKGITNIDVDTFGKTNLTILILSIIVVIALFWTAIKQFKKEQI
jgi:membrane protease YdiL (CAAX protease family)